MSISNCRLTAQTIEEGNFNLQAPLICSSDVVEPNDNYYSATFADVNSSYPNSFDIVEDEDWFSFEANTGQSYVIETLSLADEVDTFIELYDADGSTLLSSNDNNDSDLASEIEWIAPSNNLFFVRISRVEHSAYGCDANYTLSISSATRFETYLPIVLRN